MSNKKMYVVQSEAGGFWRGYNSWDTQLRKAKVFYSIKYANEAIDRNKDLNPKIVEISMSLVPESKTNADHIRAMTDEELAEFLDSVYCHGWTRGANDILDDDPYYHDWLKQPYKEDA